MGKPLCNRASLVSNGEQPVLLPLPLRVLLRLLLRVEGRLTGSAAFAGCNAAEVLELACNGEEALGTALTGAVAAADDLAFAWRKAVGRGAAMLHGVTAFVVWTTGGLAAAALAGSRGPAGSDAGAMGACSGCRAVAAGTFSWGPIAVPTASVCCSICLVFALGKAAGCVFDSSDR